MAKPAGDRPRLIVEFTVENRAKVNKRDRKLAAAAGKRGGRDGEEGPTAGAPTEAAAEAATGFGAISLETRKRHWGKSVDVGPERKRRGSKRARKKV
jgi:hypothetical protein